MRYKYLALFFLISLFFPYQFSSAGDLEVCQDAGYTSVGECNQGYCINRIGNIYSQECAGCIANPKTHICCTKFEAPATPPNPLEPTITTCIDYRIGNTLYGTTSTPSDVIKETKPIDFVPQVTIPGSIDVGGKTFSVNEGQGITVDGSLLSKYIALLFNWLIGAIGVVTVAYLAFGGMQWLAAAGNASGINKAKETIRDSVVGLLLVIGSYTMLYVINPNLVGFKELEINKVDGIVLIGAAKYEAITGKKYVKAFSEDMKVAMRQASQAANIHYCVLHTIFTKESAGRVDAIGHDENVRGEGIPSRRNFVNPPNSCKMQNGQISSGNCSITGLAKNSDDPINIGQPGLGLDWRYSHGIGVGQITVFPTGPACNGTQHCISIGGKLYDPRSLIDMDTNLEAIVKLWKTEKCPGTVTQDCFRKYNGSGEAAELYGREAWSIYNTCLTQNP